MDDDITGKDFRAAEGAERWRIISDGVTAFYPTASFQVSARLVDAIGAIDGIDEQTTRTPRNGGRARIQRAIRQTSRRADSFLHRPTD